MSNSKIEVGYVFKFDCNNTVPRLKGALEPGENVSARVSREIKPRPESMTTWYDLEIPTVVHEAFAVRLTAPEIRDMGGELDIPATASEFSAEIIAASDEGDHKKVCSIWGSIGQSENVEIGNQILIEMHKLPAVVEAVVEAAKATGPSAKDMMREENERKDAERSLWALGYDERFDEVTGMTYWAHIHTGARFIGTAREVLNSLSRA